ncbi:hypothetical protein [Nocardioides convexus]|uniref:hypothetical protein n=1 Tax=Nocardioides convexus TaxID=2712224 RepID=UPI002418A002|nr:hypothetical protein [Nocardioides convexus]
MRNRERNYSHANAARVRDDPQVLARIGEASAAVFAAEAATLRVAGTIQEVADLAPLAEGLPEQVAAANERAEIESSAAQVVVTQARPGPDDRPVRHPRRVGHGAVEGPGPALAQRPHGLLAQPAHPQGAGGGRPSRQRHPAAVRMGDRAHRRVKGPAFHGVVGSTGPATPLRLARRRSSSNVY